MVPTYLGGGVPTSGGGLGPHRIVVGSFARLGCRGVPHTPDNLFNPRDGRPLLCWREFLQLLPNIGPEVPRLRHYLHDEKKLRPHSHALRFPSVLGCGAALRRRRPAWPSTPRSPAASPLQVAPPVGADLLLVRLVVALGAGKDLGAKRFIGAVGHKKQLPPSHVVLRPSTVSLLRRQLTCTAGHGCDVSSAVCVRI